MGPLGAHGKEHADRVRRPAGAACFRASPLRVGRGCGTTPNDELPSALAVEANQIGTAVSESSLPASEGPSGSGQRRLPQVEGPPTSSRIDKSVLRIPEVRRHRDKAHLTFVASRACLICGRKPADPHHLRFAQVRALGRKVSDEFTVPLCRLHHREVHRAHNEADWWSKLGIDALAIALKLWKTTRATKETAPTTVAEVISAGPPADSTGFEEVRAGRPSRRRAR